MHGSGPDDQQPKPPLRRDVQETLAKLPDSLPSNTRPAIRERTAGQKAILIILIIVVGIPVGLFIFGALLFGVCMLGMR